MGKRCTTLINNFWKNQKITTKQNNFYGKPFREERGVTQGGIISPTILNIVVDAIIQVVEKEIKENNLNNQNTLSTTIFYEDDGYLSGDNYENVQEMLNNFTNQFKTMGLEMNQMKYKMMIRNIKTHTHQNV